MKKCALGIVSVVIVSCISFSCSQSKSLQELLQEESKAMDQFITSSDLVILKDYPKDGVFKENEYFKSPEGLFFHVVDSGNGRRVQLRDEVCVRFDYCQLVKDVASGDTTKIYFPYTPTYLYTGLLTSLNGQPYSFIYGLPQTYSGNYSPVCQAWIIPLLYVGEDAIVDMIIPSSIGSYTDNSSVLPVFYKNLHYTRFN
jgi:hypothetical protein